MSAEVELLREAARVMRERASVATEGPWYPDWDSGVYAMPDMDPEWVISGGDVGYDDTEHIASWHPAVALAVADWLDETAGHVEHHVPVWSSPHAITGGDPDMVRALVEDHYGRALAVARAYLGRQP